MFSPHFIVRRYWRVFARSDIRVVHAIHHDHVCYEYYVDYEFSEL